MANKVSLIDAHDREIIAWRAVAGGGISGSDVRDMILEAVEALFGDSRTPAPFEGLSANGSPCTARETRRSAAQLDLAPCFAPVAGRESDGSSEAFVKTLKSDCARVNPLPDAATAPRRIAGWFEDCTENHPHSGLRMRPPREFRRAHQPAEASGRQGATPIDAEAVRGAGRSRLQRPQGAAAKVARKFPVPAGLA